MAETKYCKFCGEVIDADCIVCPKCGKQVEELKRQNDQPIVINNSASASVTTGKTREKIKHSLLLDIILICCTGGLWIFWMIFRPKYRYV